MYKWADGEVERSWTGQVWGRWADEEGVKEGREGGGVKCEDKVSIFFKEKVSDSNRNQTNI